MIPKRTFLVSGESSAYTPPAQPFGTPETRTAAADPPAALINLRREIFISGPIEPPLEEAALLMQDGCLCDAEFSKGDYVGVSR